MNKNSAQNVVIVIGHPNDVEARSQDNVFINKAYRLIYTNSIATGKFAFKELMGLDVQDGLGFIRSQVANTPYSVNEFRSFFLMPIIEAWGRRQLNLPFAKGTTREIKLTVKKALSGNKKCLRYVNFMISAYMACHLHRYDDAACTVLIDDSTISGSDAKSIYENGAEWLRRTMTKEQCIEAILSKGVFKTSYPNMDQLSIYMPA